MVSECGSYNALGSNAPGELARARRSRIMMSPACFILDVSQLKRRVSACVCTKKVRADLLHGNNCDNDRDCENDV